MKISLPYRVLIADDESLISNVIQSELESIGCWVIGRAFDGRQAVEMARALKPDVVLMDISMPELDGIEAVRQIQATDPRPVVLLTAHDDAGLVARASEAGAGAYLVKPPNGPELARTMAIAVARHADLMELRRLNAELKMAMEQVKTLSGLLPICSCCKRIRDDKGYWHQVENYISAHSAVQFSHGICMDCIKEHYPDAYRNMVKTEK